MITNDNGTRNTKGNTMIKFETGKTYWTRSIGDWNCIFKITVTKRTTKTITADVDGEGSKRMKIRPNYEGTAETVMPFGSYSMAPTISAESGNKEIPAHPIHG